MKVFCWVPNPHANGAGLNFKSNLRPATLACFTKRENFKNFKECEGAVNLPLKARVANRAVGAVSSGFEAHSKMANREAVSARRAGFVCRGAKTAGATPIDAAASENISNFAAREYCADRKNFKIFASDEIKFATHGELKFATRSMAKFTACSVKFEPRSTAARDFALCDRILNPRPRKSRASFKVSSRRGEKTK
ncbi:hypothetical protein [uncultured Campylobacter sp.]|uniref:hypothetical protein n=1 Tax=uncultured Campylobacter sp. TaxID=218934 RepID=UPI00262B2A20|nr:hypothetical protein [uncultured Campylobacter sp.]